MARRNRSRREPSSILRLVPRPKMSLKNSLKNQIKTAKTGQRGWYQRFWRTGLSILKFGFMTGRSTASPKRGPSNRALHQSTSVHAATDFDDRTIQFWFWAIWGFVGRLLHSDGSRCLTRKVSKSNLWHREFTREPRWIGASSHKPVPVA